MANTMVIEKYLELTKQIKVLTDERKLLQVDLDVGRSYGSTHDISKSITHRSSINMELLRRYVMPDIIDRCTTTTRVCRVAVLAKLKPKKLTKKELATQALLDSQARTKNKDPWLQAFNKGDPR